MGRGKRAGLVAVAALVTLLTSAPAARAAVPPAQWPLDMQHFRADDVWQHSQGDGVTVAVLDSGVDATTPELADRVLPGAGFVGVASDIGHTDLSSDSHGTAVAGIIAGTGAGDPSTIMFGLAPRAKILPVRITLDGAAQPVALAQGIFFAVDHGARILTLSLGSTDPVPTVGAAVTYALAHGVIVVAAAGNLGTQGNPPFYPAALPGVVSVTGVDDSGEFWPDSGSGPTTTLAAPATHIYTTAAGGKHITGNGTSYAAPYVAAAAALVWSAHPDYTASQVTSQLVRTADQHGSHHDDRYGYGIVNPIRALTGIVPPSTPQPASSRTGWYIATTGALVVIGFGVVLWRRRRPIGIVGSRKKTR